MLKRLSATAGRYKLLHILIHAFLFAVVEIGRGFRVRMIISLVFEIRSEALVKSKISG